jgi:hypothetical protein
MSDVTVLRPHRRRPVSDQDGYLDAPPVWVMRGAMVLTAALCLGVFWVGRHVIQTNAWERRHRAALLQEKRELKGVLIELKKTRKDLAWLAPEIARLDREIRAEQKRGGR